MARLPDWLLAIAEHRHRSPADNRAWSSAVAEYLLLDGGNHKAVAKILADDRRALTAMERDLRSQGVPRLRDMLP